MSISVTVDGVAREVQELTISQAQNNRDRATFRFMVPNGVPTPTIDDELIVTETRNSVPYRIFGGTIKNPVVSGLAGTPTEAYECNVSALDFNELGDRQIVPKMTIAKDTTLKAAAGMLLPYLPGVTLTMSPNGPALPELVYELMTVTAILDDLCQNTGWLRNINYEKELDFWQPGTWSAPWNITDHDGNTVGDVTVSQSRTDYANQVLVRFSEHARAAYQYMGCDIGENFHNEEEVTLGGVTYQFLSSGPFDNNEILIGATGNVSLQHLAIAIAYGGENFGSIMSTSITPHSECTAWDMGRPAPMICVKAKTAGASGNSIGCTTTATDVFWYGEGTVPHDHLYEGADEGLSNMVIVNDLTAQGQYGIYSRIVDAPTIFNAVDATALGEQALSVYSVVENEVTYQTYREGLYPGMTQSIQVTDRSINASCLLTAINYNIRPGDDQRRTVTAIAGTKYDGSKWRDMYKTWSGGTGSSAQTVAWIGGGGGTSTVAVGVYPFGGSRALYITPNPKAWTPIAEWVPVKATMRFSARVRLWLWARGAGIVVSGRLTSSSDGVTYGTVVGTVTDVTGPTPTERTLDFTAEADTYYRLEGYPGVDGEGVGCVGYAESL